MQVRFLILFLLFLQNAFAQTLSDTIAEADVQKHLYFLAGDSLKGRGNYTPELHQAAHYISAEFKKAGAVFLPSLSSYYHAFTTHKVATKKLLPDTAGHFNSAYVLLNVVGVLPGKSRPNEVIIFSAHYDGLGMEKKAKDPVYNGANDNASGTAAMLSLLHYYAQRADNGRTLIFCAFAGEEIGLTGSSQLAEMINPKLVKAMINIEMIGRHNAVGPKSFFITGAHRSNLAAEFRKTLKGHEVRIRPEPADEKELFMRSDNYPFVLKGITAHTIMSSDDDDACYHSVCDEAERIDLPNMTEIIRAIVTCSRTLIDGSFTPSRIR